jgi:hypothetical protein
MYDTRMGNNVVVWNLVTVRDLAGYAAARVARTGTGPAGRGDST